MTAHHSERLKTAHIPTPAVERREPLRAELELLTDEYLASGKSIEQIGIGVMANTEAVPPHGDSQNAEQRAKRSRRAAEQTKLTNRQKAVKI